MIAFQRDGDLALVHKMMEAQRSSAQQLALICADSGGWERSKGSSLAAMSSDVRRTWGHGGISK